MPRTSGFAASVVSAAHNERRFAAPSDNRMATADSVHRPPRPPQPSSGTSTTSPSTTCGITNPRSGPRRKEAHPRVFGDLFHRGCAQAHRRFAQILHRLIHRLCCIRRTPSLAWGTAHGGICTARRRRRMSDARALLEKWGQDRTPRHPVPRLHALARVRALAGRTGNARTRMEEMAHVDCRHLRRAHGRTPRARADASSRPSRRAERARRNAALEGCRRRCHRVARGAATSTSRSTS